MLDSNFRHVLQTWMPRTTLCNSHRLCYFHTHHLTEYTSLYLIITTARVYKHTIYTLTLEHKRSVSFFINFLLFTQRSLIRPCIFLWCHAICSIIYRLLSISVTVITPNQPPPLYSMGVGCLKFTDCLWEGSICLTFTYQCKVYVKKSLHSLFMNINLNLKHLNRHIIFL